MIWTIAYKISYIRCMKLISESKELKFLFQDNLKWCDSLYFATAWASPIKGLFEKLLEERKKIKLGVVGIHFYQTHPDFIKEFIDDKKVKFIMQTSGTFHPKIYLFQRDEEWRLIVGSANLTNAAFSENSEVCIYIENKDDDNDDMIGYNALDILCKYKNQAESFDRKKFESYKATWAHQQKRIRSLSSEYGSKDNGSTKNASRPTFLRDLSWEDFFANVLNENKKEKGRFEKRVQLLKKVKELFQQKEANGHFKRFSDYPLEDRKLIAGLDVDLKGENGKILEWGLFGSMDGARKFYWYVVNESEKISDALECIPREGAVEREQYNEFVKRFRKLERVKLSTATRLLAMKRPDYFICVDKENSEGLSDFLGISNIINQKKEKIFDVYWDDVISRIRDFIWWNEKKPSDKTERFVWENRAAFFDSLFYKK